MMIFETLLLDVQPPFAYLTFNRPAQRNAINFHMMRELVAAFQHINALPDVRAVVLSGAGGNFSAGGDLGDLQAAASMTPEEQDQTVGQLDVALRLINESPKVIIAKIDGMALGGGFGIVCVSDIAIASTTAVFGLPEVRLGLAPAVIAPYVIQRIGITRARLLMLTGSRFDGVSAHEYGIISEVVPVEVLDEAVSALVEQFRQCSPNALAACKQLLHVASTQTLDQSLPYRARLLNTLRGSEEGQEGLLATMQKRPPKWASPS